jgi:CheY-like chemotaxis protein
MRYAAAANGTYGASMSMDEPRSDSPQQALAGRRVLVVEDSPVVAEATDQMLCDMGCVVVGPATTMAPALEMAGEERLDAALVDLNIRGGKAFPVLRILRNRSIPFLITSGYADWSMPDEWQHQPRLAKPYTPNQLREALLGLLPGQLP